MKKKLIALLMAASMVVGTGAVATAGEPINDLINYVTDTGLVAPNYMLTQGNSTARGIAANYMEAMVGMDDDGNLIPALAESWEYNEDATTCTFHLRKGVQWVNYEGEAMGEITSKDFVTGFEWLMNSHKGAGVNNNMKDYVVGALEYYEMTQDLDDEEAWALTGADLQEAVGVETPDDYTIVYKLLQPSPAFHTFAASAYLFPLATGYVEELGVEKAKEQNFDEMWYSGAYVPVEYVEKNNLTMKPNPLYWDTECERFDSLTWIVVSDAAQAYLLFENGEIDQVTLQASTLKSIYENEDHKYHDYLVETQPTISSYQIHFNYTKLNEDGSWDENWNKAVANENFRKAFYHGVNWYPWLELMNFINPLSCDFDTYTIAGICKFSDGTEYTERVKEILGVEVKEDAPAKYDPEAAEQYKAAAIEELTAIGVTFPIDFVYHVGGSNQTEQDQGLVVKQAIEEGLGTDFITVEIDTYVSSWTGEITGNRLQCIGIIGLSCKLGDSTGLIVGEDPYDPTAMFSSNYSHTVELMEESQDYHADLVTKLNEFSELLVAAEAIVDDNDARLEASAQAEAYYLEHALCVPLYRKISWQLTKINDYSLPPTLYGSVNRIYKNVETNSDMYTTTEWEEIKTAYYAQ